MNKGNLFTSACRYCRYYNHEGRRGGMCQQLGVPVQASWKACNLAAPPFASNWESLREIVKLENSLSLNYRENSSNLRVSNREETKKQKASI